MLPLANAPVSFGAFELTVGQHGSVPGASDLLRIVSRAGYVGIDLGPVGYLGDRESLAANLHEASLGLAGGYLEMPFHDGAAMSASFVELDDMLDMFDAASAVNRELSLPLPRPTIAVSSQGRRREVPGRAAYDSSLGYTAQQWTDFAHHANRAAQHCRDRGYGPVFHNESGGNIEAPWEIGRMLELTSYGLCLDTGHLMVGGGDPATAIRAWADRIEHFHVKSARLQRLAAIIAADEDVEAIWERRVFCRLGEGDLDLLGVMSTLLDTGYDSWVVVEQDIFPSSDSLARAADDQRHNLEALSAAIANVDGRPQAVTPS